MISKIWLTKWIKSIDFKRLKYIILSILILFTFTSCSAKKDKQTSLYKELKSELQSIKTTISNKTITYTEYFGKPSKSVEKGQITPENTSPRENNNPIKTEVKIEDNNINIEEDILINTNIEDKEITKHKLTRNNLSVMLLLVMATLFIIYEKWQNRKKKRHE